MCMLANTEYKDSRVLDTLRDSLSKKGTYTKGDFVLRYEGLVTKKLSEENHGDKKKYQ